MGQNQAKLKGKCLSPAQVEEWTRHPGNSKKGQWHSKETLNVLPNPVRARSQSTKK